MDGSAFVSWDRDLCLGDDFVRWSVLEQRLWNEKGWESVGEFLGISSNQLTSDAATLVHAAA